MPERKTENILDSFLSLEYIQAGEPPVDNQQWTFLTYMAALLGRKVYDSLGPHLPPTYPNLYTILIGESALVRKSTTIATVRKIFKAAAPHLRVGPSALTPSYLIKILSDEEVANPGTVLFEASELITLLGDPRKDDQLIKNLTDLWDCPEERTLGTRGRGEEVVRDVCINIIGGSTLEWLRDALPESSLGGGFWSRLLMILRPPSGNRVSRPARLFTPEAEQLTKDIIHDLKQLIPLNGKFIWTPAAEDAWDEWYESPEFAIPNNAPHFMRGYYGRRGDMLRKLCMILSCCRGTTLEITDDDFHRANLLLSINESHLEELTQEMTLSAQGRDFRLFEEGFKALCTEAEDHYITRSQITLKFKNRFKARDIDEHLKQLADSGRLGKTSRRIGNSSRETTLYTYLGDR